MTQPKDALGRHKRPLKLTEPVRLLVEPKTRESLLKMAQEAGSSVAGIVRRAVEREVRAWRGKR